MEVGRRLLSGAFINLPESIPHSSVPQLLIPLPSSSPSFSSSAAVLAAEVVRHYFPRLVELHNYSAANSFHAKLDNWRTLNEKVFKKLGFVVPRREVESVCNGVPGSVERVLKLMKVKMAAYKTRRGRDGGDSTTGSPAAATLPRVARMAAAAGDYATTSGGSAGRPATHHGPSAANQHFESSGGFDFMDGSSRGGGSKNNVGGGGRGGGGGVDSAAMEELRSTLTIMEAKVQKLEQLVRLKDAKIQALMTKLQQQTTTTNGTH